MRFVQRHANALDAVAARPQLPGFRGFRHLQIGTDQVTIALMREGKYDQILKRMENVLDLSKECRFCGEDGIWVGAE